jgi:transposase InsO family protein
MRRETLATGLARSSISTSKNSAVSTALATTSLDAARAIAAAKAQAGNSPCGYRRPFPGCACRYLPQQKKESAVTFLVATVAYFKSPGITVERVMTDNGSWYLSKAFARACKQLAVRHIRIKPDTPQTNGKAERFIQTALKMGLRHRLQAFTATIRHALRLAPSLQLAQASC